MGDKILVTVHFKNESKKISLDKLKTVQELIEQDIASRLDLQDLAYFSVSEDVNGIDRWLDHEAPVEEQIQPSSHIHFKVKYWKHPKEITDVAALTLFYYQIQKNIVAGAWTCTEAQAIKLAAHQVQVEFGNHNSTKHKAGFLDAIGLSLFLPPEHLPPNDNSNAHYQKRIFDQHALIPPLASRTEALRRYIEIAEQLPAYGITYFDVKEENIRDVRFGVSEAAIYLFSPTMDYLEQYLFSGLRGWVGAKESSTTYKGIIIQKREEDKRRSRTISADDDDDDDDEELGRTKSVNFTTTHQQAVTILELLTGYALLLQTSLPKWMKASSATLDAPPPGLPPSSLFEAPSTTARVFPPKFYSSVVYFKSLYIASCTKGNLPPILKICQQVDDATDRNSWLNKLDLSDCTITDKSIEPIISALAGCKAKEVEGRLTTKRNSFFNNVNITELDLSNTQIDPQKSNIQGLLHPELKYLNLSQNKLGTLKVGLVLLPPLISNICSQLETLDLSSNLLTKETLEILLGTRYPTLRTLILNNNKIGDKGCPLITSFISSSGTLTRVDLTNIGVKDEGLDALCTSIKFSNSLQALDLSGNSFSMKGATQLKNALAVTKVLNRLVIGSGKLSQDVGRIIGESLKQNLSLTALDCRNNGFGKACYQAFSESLKDNTRLCYLNLDGNPFEGTSGMFCDALVNNKSLTSLSLRSTDLSKGEFPFGRLLQKNSMLMNLDIAHNALTSKHVEEFYEGLGENTCLVYLNLCGNPVGDEGVSLLVKSLNYHEALVSLNMDCTQITDAGLKQLAEMLYANEVMKTLSLQTITEQGIVDFLGILSHKKEHVLRKVDFSYNKTRPESKEVALGKAQEYGLAQLNVIL